MKIQKYFVVLTVLLALTWVNFYSFTTEDTIYSEYEYRNMAVLPEYTEASFLDGSYFSKLETYNLDQIVVRNDITKANSYFQNLMKVKIRNGYNIIDNELLLTYSNYRSVNELELNELSQNKTAILKKLQGASEGKHLVFIDIPDKEYIYHKKMPFGMVGNYDFSYGKTIRTLKDADDLGILSLSSQDLLMSHIDSNIYYKSDHHFTIEGASYVYDFLLRSLNDNFDQTFKTELWEDMAKETLDKEFSGSAARAIGDISFSQKDVHTVAYPIRFGEHLRFEGGEESELPLLGESTPATYGNLMSGDRANTLVQTNRPELPSILFIGDSFTNALEYLAVSDFNEMHSLDPRHYTGSIYEYIESVNVDFVVIVRDSLMKADYYR